jgi:hypothetical protein
MNLILGFEELFDSGRVSELASRTWQPGGVFEVGVPEPSDAGDTKLYRPLPRFLDVDHYDRLYIGRPEDFLITARELSVCSGAGRDGTNRFWATYGQQIRIQAAFPRNYLRRSSCRAWRRRTPVREGCRVPLQIRWVSAAPEVAEGIAACAERNRASQTTNATLGRSRSAQGSRANQHLENGGST